MEEIKFNKYSLTGIKIILSFILLQCTLKKDKTSIYPYQPIEAGISFMKNSIQYVSLKVPEELGATKKYDFNMELIVTYNDTTLKLSGKCYNLNYIPGIYYIIANISIKHFKGTGIYHKSNFSIYFYFGYDVTPVYALNSYDGYIRVNTFDWKTKKGEGNFFFKIFDGSGLKNDTIKINDGLFIF